MKNSFLTKKIILKVLPVSFGTQFSITHFLNNNYFYFLCYLTQAVFYPFIMDLSLPTASPWPFHLWNSRCLSVLDIFFIYFGPGHMLTSEARSSRLHYSYYNLGWESSHIYQIPCLRRGAHCLYKSNTGTLGRGGGGQAGPDGGKISPSGPAFTLIQPYSQRQSAGNWRGARGGLDAHFDCLACLNSQTWCCD